MERPLVRLLSLLAWRRRSLARRSLVATLAVAAVVAVRASLPLDNLPFLFFIPVLIGIGFVLGLGPGLYATILSALAAAAFFVAPSPGEALTGQQWAATILFGVVNGGIVAVSAALGESLQRREADLRALRESRAALAEREGFLRGVLDASPDSIAVLDLEGRLTFLSESSQNLLEGGEAAIRQGHAWSEFWQGRAAEEARAAVAAARRGGRGQFQGFARISTGERHFWDVLVAPIPGPDGRPERLLAVARDITPTHVAEERLRELNETLEQRIAVALAEQARTEEQLRQSQKMEAVGQLTGGLAHDFNNLLTVVAGSLALLRSRMAQGRMEDLGRYLNAVEEASDRAAALTRRLLAFSRRQSLDPRPTDVHRLVEGMTELIRRTTGPEITLELRGGPGLWTVLADPHLLESALLNLCINARDAMPGGGRLVIELSNVALDAAAVSGWGIPPGEYLSLCVTDTGVGMTPEVAARIFEPFFTTKPPGEGTGLGLPMVQGFVRQSGGAASVRTAPGKGTTICLHLPRHHGPAAAEAPPAALATTLSAHRGEAVLVVDDEEAVRTVTAEALAELGYDVLTAADAASALATLRSGQRVDLLVADIRLPGGMDGRQLALAAREELPGLPVIFITGYAGDLPGEGNLPEAALLLRKPFAPEVLVGRVRQLLGAEAGA